MPSSVTTAAGASPAAVLRFCVDTFSPRVPWETPQSQERDLACYFWETASSTPALGALAGGVRTHALPWRLKWAR